ncbi:MAG: hypothetical protein O3A93_10795 [Chloroflexi bacterium]|nr:hypothetical protein [Chloroflexota bacterium]MDA1271728.1 hypothetical protein [Chloroflexota bacterium]PKB59144.1 MAG: hypothetical protein BZY83_03470 [SAR202 cluster bacterium Casp-Chloro-G2]
MMYLKECPKCQGDLYEGSDMYGQYVSCLQCGYSRDLPVASVTESLQKTSKVNATKTVKRSRKKVKAAA